MILPNPIEATGKSGPNWPKIILTGFVILAGLFLIWQFTFAFDFSDSFETYPDGNLTAWNNSYPFYDIWQVVSSTSYAGTKSAFCSSGNCYAYKITDDITTGTMSYATFQNICSNDTPNIRFERYTVAGLGGTSGDINCEAYIVGSSTSAFIGDYATGTWNLWELQFSGYTFRARINAGVWSDYVPYSFNLFPNLFAMSFDSIGYIDSFGGVLANCEIYTTPYGCEYEGPNQQPTLNCSWNYASSTCGPYQPPPATTTSFIDYYDENSSFATPTVFILAISDFVGPLIENIQSFLTGFDNVFDKAQASAKGAEFGSAIPTARGYLAVINDFFGGFPVSELFIFLILTILVIIVFRVIRTLIQLVKV